ncbi:fimbria/pilus chaperone family protein [Pseudomonas chlororaphis]|uniref:fimbria/pilus chaperone family protein n=1 Tax=Pseudomonas chlororaphis TaxID=587753 RepID=UPI0013897102|nr:fimbria/pilus chaperone family protein [Pseudomonas chlororaphis]QQX56983.1 fimbria/pilus periplasmic chaperone [Pseudomonas chlororaphis subsp. aurantiaca]UVE43838.1 fimbria/pilus periplasmic chaperone [Pseudomonas chlororaphis]
MLFKIHQHRLIITAFISCTFSLLAPHAAYAAGMIPETSVVILDESVGETTINIKNSDASPALLYSSIENLNDDKENLIVLTPPVARVEPGETQAVRFLLNSPTPLKVQRLRRVTFEGILPKDKSAGARIGMNVRQNLPVIINPKGLEKDREPWLHLKWSAQGKNLTVENPSAYVVRLGQSVNILPSNTVANLPKLYVLPGEKITIALPTEVGAGATAVKLYPATVYGFSVESYEAPLSK